jgi:O-antigen ligase
VWGSASTRHYAEESALVLIGAVVLLAPIIITPTQLIERFAAMPFTEKVSADTRLLLWKQTLPLISEFRLFGTGLGGFESAFLNTSDQQ